MAGTLVKPNGDQITIKFIYGTGG